MFLILSINDIKIKNITLNILCKRIKKSFKYIDNFDNILKISQFMATFTVANTKSTASRDWCQQQNFSTYLCHVTCMNNFKNHLSYIWELCSNAHKSIPIQTYRYDNERKKCTERNEKKGKQKKISVPFI